MAAGHSKDMDADVIIVGGGLNGPALALALAQGGLRVVVVDARPTPVRAEAGFDGRAYALAIASQRLLAAVGVWGRVADKVQPILKIKSQRRTGRRGRCAIFPDLRPCRNRRRPDGLHAGGPLLVCGLSGGDGAGAGVTLLSGESVCGAGAGVGDAGLGPGADRAGAVGCDGRGFGRGRAGRDRRQGWGYGQTALVTAVRHERPHLGIAHQFFMPSGPLAILPLPGGHHSSIVWSEAEAVAAPIRRWRMPTIWQALRPRFGDFLGEIALAGARFTYPSACRSPSVSWRQGWRWSAMRRMGCIPWPGRG